MKSEPSGNGRICSVEKCCYAINFVDVRNVTVKVNAKAGKGRLTVDSSGKIGQGN